MRINQFVFLLIGTYLALFLAPTLSFIFWKRYQSKDGYVLTGTVILMVIGYFSWCVGISIVGVLADAVFLFFLYILFAISALKLTNYSNKVIKFIGAFYFVSVCGLATLSTIAFLGVVFAVGDFETEYEFTSTNGYGCRVSSFGNATTSNGGYNASVFKVLGLFEKEVDFISVDNARKPKISPEDACNAALLEFKS